MPEKLEESPIFKHESGERQSKPFDNPFKIVIP